MIDWIVSLTDYIFSNWQSLLVGGLVVMGVVIFLMGVLKKLVFNRLQNKLLRKVILSFFSLILVLPATVLSILYNKFDMDYFWVFYTVNAFGTIIVYWFYENTGLRNLLALIGKNTVLKLFQSENREDAMSEANEEAAQMLKGYDEKDLEDL